MAARAGTASALGPVAGSRNGKIGKLLKPPDSLGSDSTRWLPCRVPVPHRGIDVLVAGEPVVAGQAPRIIVVLRRASSSTPANHDRSTFAQLAPGICAIRRVRL